MERERKRGFVGLIVAKIVCCGVLVLALTGALGGVGAWLLGDGLVWLVPVAAVAAASLLVWWRRRPRDPRPDSLPQVRDARAR